MIESREQYELIAESFRRRPGNWPHIQETIEALREVVLAINRAEYFSPGYLTPSIMRALDEVPRWIKEEAIE